MEEAQVFLNLVPGGAARRSPDRATGGVAGCETNSFPGGESPSSVPAADHTISYVMRTLPRGGGNINSKPALKEATWCRPEIIRFGTKHVRSFTERRTSQLYAGPHYFAPRISPFRWISSVGDPMETASSRLP